MSFEDIKGQDSALAILREAVGRDRIFANYLFVGPDGVGKRFAAKNFAKAINCLKRETADPCDACASCKKIDLEAHPDVFFIEPKGASLSISIEVIREVINRANLKPYEAKKKIFIIDGAHSMNITSSNAFLKTLEEPPADAIFILISNSKDALLPTVRSRCHTVKFLAAPLGVVEDIVTERFNIAGNEAKILSTFSSGRIGEAVRMKEKDLLKSKNTLIDNLLNNKRNFAGELENYSDREDFKTKLGILVSYFRDILLYKTVKDERMLFHIDRIDEIKSMCERFTEEELAFFINRIITLSSYADYNVNPKLIVSVLVNEIGSIK